MPALTTSEFIGLGSLLMALIVTTIGILRFKEGKVIKKAEFEATVNAKLDEIQKDLDLHVSDCREDKQIMWEAIHKKADK